MTKSTAVATWWLRLKTFAVGSGVGCGSEVGVGSIETVLNGADVGVGAGGATDFSLPFTAVDLVEGGFGNPLSSGVASGTTFRVDLVPSSDAEVDFVRRVDFIDSGDWFDI